MKITGSLGSYSSQITCCSCSVAVLLIAGFLLAPAVTAATFIVNSTTDEPDDNTTDNLCHTTAGTCTLRAAIQQANATTGADIVRFAIAGTAVHTIRPTSSLPAVLDPVTIDGYTQPGSSPNTLAVGDDAVLKIELDGTLTTSEGYPADGIVIQTDYCTIRGLVINRFRIGIAIEIQSTLGGHVIQGNFIGTDATGSTALPNAQFGIEVSSPNNLIGGPSPADRNVVSGNSPSGLNSLGYNVGFFSGATATTAGSVIQGNYIGTDASGLFSLAAPESGGGILVMTRTAIEIPPAVGGGVTIGGPGAGEGNLIAGNRGTGVELRSFPCPFNRTTGVIIQGNAIGVNAAGAPLGNGGPGVWADCNAPDNGIGGLAPGAGNVIAYNGSKSHPLLYPPGPGGGVRVNAPRIWIRGNSIHDNGGLGIDVSVPQNSPILTSVTYGVSDTRIQGLLDSTPGTTFEFDFFANPPCLARPRDLLEGQTYLGSTEISTDGSGNASFDVTLPATLVAGSHLTATATDPYGNTSEFSQELILSSTPAFGPASGTDITLDGYHFLPGASVSVGGVLASNDETHNPNLILARTPVLPPGTAYDITVQNTDDTTGVLRRGFVADPLDVPPGSPFEKWVASLLAADITAGCGGGNYCAGSPVTRAQMAVLLLRSKNGTCYAPPPAAGTVFGDVRAGAPAADWIEALAAEGVTSGCGSGNYCPNDPTTRAQMAVFLLRTLEGISYTPPACVTPTFPDVPCSSGFSRWVNELALRGITAGCGSGLYCPTASVTRGQMAVFLTTTFSLILNGP